MSKKNKTRGDWITCLTSIRCNQILNLVCLARTQVHMDSYLLTASASLPLKRFIQNTSLRGGFFQAHLYPAVISVSWLPPPPNQSCQQQRRGAWMAFNSRPQREGLLLPQNSYKCIIRVQMNYICIIWRPFKSLFVKTEAVFSLFLFLQCFLFPFWFLQETFGYLETCCLISMCLCFLQIFFL